MGLSVKIILGAILQPGRCGPSDMHHGKEGKMEVFECWH
jgi:hypothetical protein